MERTKRNTFLKRPPSSNASIAIADAWAQYLIEMREIESEEKGSILGHDLEKLSS